MNVIAKATPKKIDKIFNKSGKVGKELKNQLGVDNEFLKTC